MRSASEASGKFFKVFFESTLQKKFRFRSKIPKFPKIPPPDNFF